MPPVEKAGKFPDLEIHRLNDKLGLHLVVLYVLVGNDRFPWSFRVWRGKGEASQPLLALRMLAQLPEAWQAWFKVRVLGDAGKVACVPPLRERRVHPRSARSGLPRGRRGELLAHDLRWPPALEPALPWGEGDVPRVRGAGVGVVVQAAP